MNDLGLIFFENPISRCYLNICKKNNYKFKYILALNSNSFLPNTLLNIYNYYKMNHHALKFINKKKFKSIINEIENFFNYENNFFKRKINLGLDLQGGSYLLLEVDNQPVITQKLQNKLTSIRKFLNTENIKFKNLKLSNNNIIIFETKDEFIEKLKNIFEDKESSLNPYIKDINLMNLNI